jgi:hypothetical protein
VLADCRLALALAFDVSRSVSARDYETQKQGLLEALDDPAIVSALLGADQPVALALYEWSRVPEQDLVLDWTLIRTPADLATIRATVAAHQRLTTGGTTALGEALRFGRALLSRAPTCDRQVIDVSGDGQNNAGASPRAVYEMVDFGEVQVNGLAIRSYERRIVSYYEEQVIRGRDAFVEVADGPRDFPRAIRRKLLREISDQMLGGGAAPIGPRG